MERELYRSGNIEDFYLFLDEKDTDIAIGSTSIVKKAINMHDEELYAVKIMDSKEVDPKTIRQELQVMSYLNHPNIVKLYEFYQSENIIFLVYEWMDGGELFDRISRTNNYTEYNVCQAFRKIVDGVRYCHAHNIVHRDLKVSF